VRVWRTNGSRDALTGTVLEGHVGKVTYVRELADGSALSVGEDSTVRVWDTKGARCTHVLRLGGHVCMAAELPDGKVVTASRGNGRKGHVLKVWNLLTARCEHSHTVHAGKVAGLAVRQNGGVVLACEGGVFVWH